VLRVADQPEAARLARRRAVAGGSLLVVAAAAAAAATGVGLARPHAPAAPRQAGTTRTDGAALAAAATNRNLAAAWITAQVSHGVIVACDPLMCATLQRAGFPASDLDPLGTGAGDPLGSGLVVSTTALRTELGARLATIYAPMVVASFGSGQSTVAVRVTAPDGGAAYLSALHSDLLARRQAGQQLVKNRNVRVPSAGQVALAGGQVDSRLLITIATLAHSVPVAILGFSDAGPDASAGMPLRTVSIDGAIGLPHHANYAQTVLAFLRAQRAPYRATVAVTGAGPATRIVIEFAAPSPLGLLTGHPPS
jgi:hypothetical protein